MIVNLPQDQYEKMVKRAKDVFPKEGCGLVAGHVKDDKIEVTKVFNLTNTDDSEEHFSLDPKEQFATVKEIRNRGEELVGNYHSHPFTPARPSEEDKRLAYDESLLYFILSLKGDEPNLKVFEIKDQSEVTEVELKIT